MDVVYSLDQRPFTSYPQKLVVYLIERYSLSRDMKLLEVGVGRGEFISKFMEFGMHCVGLDNSSTALKYFPDLPLVNHDLDSDRLPFSDNHFDVVFSKSVVEHFYNPENLTAELARVTKPGGMIITMTPSWIHNIAAFYQDHTHRTPFTLESIRDIQLMQGLQIYEVSYFRQLPILWKFPWLTVFAELTRFLPLPQSFKKFKWVRFSKEIMLIAVAKKPG